MIEYDNTRWMVVHLFRKDGSVIPASLIMAIPSGILCVLIMIFNHHYPDFQIGFGSKSIQAATVWNAVTVVLFLVLAFRTDKAYSRFWEGTTLLHQMRGEWFDAASCLFAFSKLAKDDMKKRNDVLKFRHALIRLMSLCHGHALELIKLDTPDDEEESAETGFEYIDVGGLDQKVLRYLSGIPSNKISVGPGTEQSAKGPGRLKFNKVEVLIHMMQTLIVDAQRIGAIKIPPPILSRVFQTLSRGQVNLMNCSKIKATYFPFPYAQLIAFMLYLLCFMTPVVMSGVLEHYHWGFICTFTPLFCICGINFAAIELEMPFGDDSNDLPLLKMHDEMNYSMLMLIRDEADLVAGTGNKCEFNWHRIAKDLFEPNTRSERKLSTYASSSPLPQKEAQPVSPAIAPAAVAPTPAPAAPDPCKETPSVAIQELEAKVAEQTNMMDRHLEKFHKLDQTFEVLVQSASGLFELLQQNTELLTSVSKSATEVALSNHAGGAASTGSPMTTAPSDAAMAKVPLERQMLADSYTGPCPVESPSAATNGIVHTQELAQTLLADADARSPGKQHPAKHEVPLPDLGTKQPELEALTCKSKSGP